MNKDEAEKDNLKSNPSGIPIVLDTSVLFAYLCEDDSNHRAVKSALGAIEPYNPTIYIPVFVILEVVSNLIRKGNRNITKAKNDVSKFLKRFDTREERREMNIKLIFDKYTLFSRSKFNKLTGNDFYIVVEAILLEAFLVTCDVKMWEMAKLTHKNKTFLLTNKETTELPELIKRVTKEFSRTEKKISAKKS